MIAVLLGVTVRIRPGDRLLLEGPSGGGKSTLAALLAGCRVPGSGLLLLDGLDRETVGAAAGVVASSSPRSSTRTTSSWGRSPSTP